MHKTDWAKQLAALLLALLLLASPLCIGAAAAEEPLQWNEPQLVPVERNGDIYTTPKPPEQLVPQAVDTSFDRAALLACCEDALRTDKITVNASGQVVIDISALNISCAANAVSLNDTGKAIFDSFSQFTDPDINPRYYFFRQFPSVNDGTVYYYTPGINYVQRSGRYVFATITMRAAFTPFNQANLRAELGRYDKGIADALAQVPGGLSPVEQVLFVHDWIARSCEYDYDRCNGYEPEREPWTSHTAYGVLVDGVAVCQGYAYAAHELLGRLGIETINIVSNGMGHEWNMVQLNGKWYHMDITWDDPVAGKPGRLASPPIALYTNDYWGRADHDNLLISAVRLRATGHVVWNSGDGYGNSYPSATDTTYENYFWRGSESAMVYDENAKLWLYTKAAHATRNILYCYSFVTGTVAKTITLGFTDYWETGGGYAVITAPYLCLYGSKVYYNTPKTLRYIDLADDYSDHAGPSLPAPQPAGLQSIYDLRVAGDNAEVRVRTRSGGGSAFTYSDYDYVRALRIWEPHVAYDANGGTGAPRMQFKTAGVPLALSGVIPARTGYSFLGWDPNRNASAPAYPAGQANAYTADADVTLYAVWQGYAYTIRFNANGGSGSMPPAAARYGTPLALPANAFTMEGYVFRGWSTAPGGGVAYGDRAQVNSLTAVENAAVDLYAVWAPVAQPKWWESLPAFLQLILRIFLFGWIWMV